MLSRIALIKKGQIFFYLLLSFSLQGQPILLDESIEVNGLYCFPSYTNSNVYHYLPSQGSLSHNNIGLPEFNLLRYSTESKLVEGDINTIVKAEGGGILHFLTTYSTPASQVESAQSMIRELLENDSLLLRSPVNFERGRCHLISSIEENETKKNQLLATVEAPVFSGLKVAKSIPLNQFQTALLQASLNQATADLSMTYELEFTGLSNYYEAEIEVDWERLQNSQLTGGEVGLYFLNAEIEKGFEELIDKKIIRFTEVGANTSMEHLTQAVYEKLLEILYEPVTQENLSGEEKEKMNNNIANAIKGNISKVLPFRFGVTYKRKKIQKANQTKLIFKGRSAVKRTHYITFNLKESLQNFINDERLFPPVTSLDFFQHRVIYLGIDGAIESELDQMVNYVSVSLKKKDKNGKEIIQEVLINKENFTKSTSDFSFSYSKNEEEDMNDWMSYEYKETWFFRGGKSFTTDWKRANENLINLYVPYERKEILILGDWEEINSANVKAIYVKLKYSFFGETQITPITIIPAKAFQEIKLEITLPKNQTVYDYEIVWIGKELPVVNGQSEAGAIFIDLPQ